MSSEQCRYVGKSVTRGEIGGAQPWKRTAGARNRQEASVRRRRESCKVGDTEVRGVKQKKGQIIQSCKPQQIQTFVLRDKEILDGFEKSSDIDFMFLQRFARAVETKLDKSRSMKTRQKSTTIIQMRHNDVKTRQRQWRW